MDTAMSQKELEDMLDKAVLEVTKKTAGVQLCRSGEELGEDLCTVHISFNKGFRSSLSLCADTALLNRMAKYALQEEKITPQELEDFGKEYLNILCGKIAVILFRNTKVPARFGVPVFYHGRYTPENRQTQFILTYANEHREGVQLTHHVPQSREDEIE